MALTGGTLQLTDNLRAVRRELVLRRDLRPEGEGNGRCYEVLPKIESLPKCVMSTSRDATDSARGQGFSSDSETNLEWQSAARETWELGARRVPVLAQATVVPVVAGFCFWARVERVSAKITCFAYVRRPAIGTRCGRYKNPTAHCFEVSEDKCAPVHAPFDAPVGR